jgi:hypothetical protein
MRHALIGIEDWSLHFFCGNPLGKKEGISKEDIRI